MVLIIAEAGVNHNGDIKLAKELIDIAAESGADFVKFQSFKADRLVTPSALKAEYQVSLEGDSESQLTMLRRLELSLDMHHDLINHCALKKIRFLSTGFDVESINMLLNLGQEVFKIPSGEISNLLYLRHIGRVAKSVILSTGISSMNEIGSALSILEHAGTPRDKITVLHCTSAYPVPMVDVNLRAMQTIQKTFNLSVGYSDHSLGIEIPIAAVALGASIIEKHFTVDRNLPGPDHKASLEPAEFANMVAAIRNIEVALGDGVKRPMPSEMINLSSIRQSIVARVKIGVGEIFSDENLTTKRPGNGISPMHWQKIIGKSALREYQPDEMIEL